MAIEVQPFPNSTCYGISGIYNGQSKPVFLADSSGNIHIEDIGQCGRLVIGLDTRLSPACVRMYFEPKGEIAGNSTFGFAQFCQVQMQQIPVNPSVYSPSIEYRNRYVAFNQYMGKELFGPANFWADMVPTSDLQNSGLSDLFKKFNNVPPFFAFNGVSTSLDYNQNSFLNGVMPNGSLYVPSQSSTGTNALCASLISPIGIDINTPNYKTIESFVKQCLDRSFYNYSDQSDSGFGQQISASQIWEERTTQEGANTIWQSSFLKDTLKALYSNYPNYAGCGVQSIEQVGKIPKKNGDYMFLLVKLNDPNNYFPYFCIVFNKIQAGEFNVFMYEFDSHLLADYQSSVLEERSTNFYEFAATRLNTPIFKPPSKIGVPDSFYTDDLITANYTTNVVEYTDKGESRVIYAFKWSASKTLNPSTLFYENLVITSPSLSWFNPQEEYDYCTNEYLKTLYSLFPSTGENYEGWYTRKARLPNNISSIQDLMPPILSD